MGKIQKAGVLISGERAFAIAEKVNPEELVRVETRPV